MRRLFFGYPLTDSERAEIRQRLTRDYTLAKTKLVPDDKWHITLLFLGDLPEEAAEQLIRDLTTLRVEAPGALSLDHFGTFPAPRKAKVLWLGSAEPHAGLARANETVTSWVGGRVTLDDRAFAPHLTLARFRMPKDLTPALEKLNAGLAPVKLGLKELHLLESVTVDGNHEYRSVWKSS